MQNNSEHNGLIGSLFSGYGGLDLGIDMALGGGMRVAYTSDIEPGPCAIESYHAHGDDCPNLGDITGIDFGDLPDTDVVVGGSPCFPAGSLVLTDRGFTPIPASNARPITNSLPDTAIGAHGTMGNAPIRPCSWRMAGFRPPT